MDTASTDPRRGHILLLGHDRDWSTAAAGALQARGHRVDSAAPSGAVTNLANGRPDVLVALVEREQGRALLAELRSDPALAGLYVVLASTDRVEPAAAGLLAGADDVLADPFDGREVAERVDRGLRLVELREALAAANRSLRELAMSDVLTGLPNRRAMEQILAAEAARVSRGSAGSCVVCVDVDGLQGVNDRHGVAIGDLLLVAFAGAVRSGLRGQDEFGRVGGDEFVILLRDASLAGAEEVCRRLQQIVAGVRVPCGRGELQISASFGVAPVRPGDDPGQALDVADSALYAAKLAGRNRVETATETLI